MKFLALLSFATLAAAAQYDERFDHFDVDELISNLRLLKSYVSCFTGEGKCTPEASNIKKHIPDALQSNCSQCTEKLKTMSAKVMKAMIEKLPEDWEKLVNLHDPENKHTNELKEYLNKYAP